MGDFGLKISNATKDVFTSNLDDTAFDSRYSSLFLLEKHDVEFTAPEGETSPTGTESYSHGLGYAPLVLATVSYVAASTTTTGPIPYNYTIDPGGAFSGAYLSSYINIDITTSAVEVDWETIYYLPGEEYELPADVDYTVTLYIYAYELGYTT